VDCTAQWLRQSSTGSILNTLKPQVQA